MSAALFAARPVALAAQDPRPHAFLAQFALANMAAVALATAAWRQGWVDRLLDGDSSRLGLAILATFTVGLGLATRAAGSLSRELDAARAARPQPDTVAGRYLRAVTMTAPDRRAGLDASLKLAVASRIAPVRAIAGYLVLLGLIGTVLGFIIALDGVDPARAGDVAEVGRMVATLVDGMGVALNTTLIGAILNIWLMVDYRLLEGGAVRLLTLVLEHGAGHADA
ncbi:MAG: MotA/TolQ/ExbB proton channel family protein [Geminicoccaceae bacterium]